MAVFELPPEDGEHIGPYRIVKVLGRGGMGEVFLAWDPRLNRSVAIKRIRHDSETTPILRQRLLQEAHAVGGLHHPAIVIVYDLLEDDGDDCIVMEYVHGQTLAETLKEGPFKPAFVVHLAEEIASGLAAAHETGIIHRDLKTENVMVTVAKNAKILDFGLAKPIGIAAGDPSLTEAGRVVGTCRAMSPEQARGAGVDERSDLFSLGILLYEMLTGISPFQGSNPLATLTKVITEPPPCVDTLRPGLPPRLVALLYRLLDKDPAARPQSAAEVVRELHAIAAALSPTGELDPEETVSVLPTGAIGRWGDDPTPPISLPQTLSIPPSETPHRTSRRQTVLIAIVLSLLVSTTVLILYQWYSRRLLRIVVPTPEVVGNPPPQVQLAATSLLTTSLNTLALLRGIAPVDPSEIKGSPKAPTEIARAVAADEVLIIHLESAGNLELITLRCIRGSDGRDLWTDNLQMPLDQKEPLLWLSRRLDNRLRDHLSDHPPVMRVVVPAISEEDYAAFLAIRQRVDKGQTPLEPELSQLEKIIKRTPKFLDARLLAANVAINLFQSRRDPASSDRASRLVKGAEMCDLQDPRPLQARFELELAKGQLKAAPETLSHLEDLRPGDPQNLTFRAKLAEEQGDLKAALTYQAEAADAVASWTNFLTLAGLEEKHGMVQEARRDLKRVLDDSPENIVARERLAELELYFGDPKKAEQIYRNLLASSTERADNLRLRANLGAALVLQQRYKDAADTLNSALNIDPDDIEINLNLADAEDGLGDKDSALNLYEKVHQKLKANHLESADASYEMIEAQCLAHLGYKNAGAIAYQTLSQNPDDVTLLPVAAMVFMLTNDPRAPIYVQHALDNGIQPCWFKLPSFAPLFKDPKFQQSLGGATR